MLIAVAGGAVAKGKTRTYHPLVFGIDILAAYLLAAAGIPGAGVAFWPDTGSRLISNVIAGFIALFVGRLQLGLFSLLDRVKDCVSTLAFRFRSHPGIFLLGIICAVLFAPLCHRPVPDPEYRHRTFVDDPGILVPFIALMALHRSLPGERLLRYAGIIQKLGGLLLLWFGIWLILSAML